VSNDIHEATRRLPLPALIHRLGLGEHAKKSARCPFHDDQHKSFSVWKNEAGLWFWKCHAGCGEGDEITFLERHQGISNKEATKRYLEMSGVNDATPILAKSSPTSRPTSALDWRACVEAFTEKHVEQLAKWRGYSIEFCPWLKESGLVGLFNGCIAFPVYDRVGEIVAVHYRLKDGSWRYYPQGSNVRPLVIGELVPGDTVNAFESYWDAFAFMDVSGERHGIIITRGASNGALVADVILQDAKVYLWAQNDAPGEKWAKDVCASAKVAVKRPKIPATHKDLNDWAKAGASDQDLLEAMVNAETIKEAPRLELSPEQLFQAIKNFVTRYVAFSRPEHADVITLWIMHTWVAGCADFTPYIYLHSPVMQCGKTQVHRVVEPLVKNPLRTCNVSEAALYREIEESHPTLLWDEIDSIFGNRKSSEANENKRALLNAGYERGMTAIRMERGPGGFVRISFDPFCPKILAGIGRLPDTIVDRSIPILIHRRLKTQACHKFRRQDRANAKPLHDALKTWSADPDLQKRLRETHPEVPECLTDRQEDIWEPLLAIADSIGGDVPRLARAAAETICDNEDELSYGTEQLAAIRKVIGDKSRITSAELMHGLWEADALPSRLLEDEKPNHKKMGSWLSKFIKSYGGKPARQLKFEGQNLRGYETAELQAIFDRYCPPP
jgi:hypothetical protein